MEQGASNPAGWKDKGPPEDRGSRDTVGPGGRSQWEMEGRQEEDMGGEQRGQGDMGERDGRQGKGGLGDKL